MNRLRVPLLAVVVAVLVALPAPAGGAAVAARAVAPIGAPGSTSRIVLVSSSTQGGWRYDFYRNPAYPCAVSGDNTFTIATRLGTPDEAVRPLWVFMHGGGVGYFDPTGRPVPNIGQMTEETAGQQRSGVQGGELKQRIKAHPAGFRMMAVSMCDHDFYGGPDIADPNNPNRTADGRPRTVNGLYATKAAIAFALQTRPTDDYFVLGGSAGSVGSLHVTWALDEQGIPPAGVIADSGLINQAWVDAIGTDPLCGRSAEARQIIPQRLHPEIVDPDNEPADLVADGRMSTPVLDVYSVGDLNQCGTQPMQCPLPGGGVATMGAVECEHLPMREAIAAQGADGPSLSLDLCVRSEPAPAPACATHVPTSKDLVNTRAPWPADYHGVVVDWVEERLGDDGAAPPSPRSDTEAFVTAALTDVLGSAPVAQVEAGALALDAGLSKAAYLRRLTTSDAWLSAIVDDLYQDTLGRPGDPGGAAFWVGELRSGRRTVAQVAASFYASPEYYTGLGGGTATTWITDLYEEVLGRSPEPGGVGYWTGEVARTNRTAVALRFYQSPESATTRVRGLYATLLGRQPSAPDVTFWALMVVAQGDLALAVSLAASAEYQTRAEQRFQ